MRLMRLVLVALCAGLLIASEPAGNVSGRMTADYVEACSCHLFCPCYFNKRAEHPYCEFNMAVKVRGGKAKGAKLSGGKELLTRRLRGEWGTGEKGQMGGG